MERVPEPELMDAPDQARAYAEADFEQPHAHFIDLLRARLGHTPIRGRVLDLGCGPADITIRFARAFPQCQLVGVDGAAAMLAHARAAVATAELGERIELVQTILPAQDLPQGPYAGVISNSLLHHLHHPGVLWATLRQAAAAGTWIFVMDLMRPDSRADAADLVKAYGGDEPPILQRDFFNSLLAAFTPAEVEDQLARAGLTELTVEAASDRHLVVHGIRRG